MTYDDVQAEAALALEDAGDDESLKAELHLDLCEIACATCDLGAAVAHARRAIELAVRAGATSTAVASLAGLGFAESMLGRGEPESARRVSEGRAPVAQPARKRHC